MQGVYRDIRTHIRCVATEHGIKQRDTKRGCRVSASVQRAPGLCFAHAGSEVAPFSLATISFQPQTNSGFIFALCDSVLVHTLQSTCASGVLAQWNAATCRLAPPCDAPLRRSARPRSNQEGLEHSKSCSRDFRRLRGSEWTCATVRRDVRGIQQGVYTISQPDTRVLLLCARTRSCAYRWRGTVPLHARSCAHQLPGRARPALSRLACAVADPAGVYHPEQTHLQART
jgi:hypothetical protein